MMDTAGMNGSHVNVDHGSAPANDHKVVKKTKSFREDFKVLIKRRSSSNHPMSPHHAKKERIGRNLANHSSLIDGDITPTKKLSDEKKHKLRVSTDNVHRSLRFITEVLNKQKLQILPGSATVVLETIIEMFNIVNSLFSLTDSTMLTSRYSRVYQSLAEFIQWTDDMLITGYRTFNQASAQQVIVALTEALDQLVQFALEKLDGQYKYTPQLSPILTNPPQLVDGNSNKRYSYPELPLTPREQQILETSPLSPESASTQPKSHSSDELFTTSREEDEPNLPPPPKPPLPTDRRSPTKNLSKVSKSASFEGILNNEDMPPPLPRKSRNSLVSEYENLTPIKIHHCSSDRVSLPTVINQQHQAHATPVISPIDCHSAESMLSDPFDISPLPQNHGISLSQSPLNCSPLNQSACSSISSGLNTSHDDIDVVNHRIIPISRNSPHFGSESPPISGKSPQNDGISPIMMSNFPKQSIYDTMMSPTTRLNQLMTRMNKLSLSLNTEQKPLLPDKQRPRLLSAYDNLPSEPFMQPFSGESNEVVQGHISYKAAMGNTSLVHQQSYSSSETFSSGSHTSVDSLTINPPPLPPKTRHIQEYMKTIGSYTQPSAQEIFSRHSLNVYGLQWHQHHIELFHPRSNTVSIMSDLSSTGSDVYSSSSGSTEGPPSPWRQLKDTQSESSGSNSGLTELPICYDSREKASSLIETPISIEYTNNGTLKRASAPITLDDSRTECTSLASHKDTDSDFAEINVLDDVDVSDQLIITKKQSEEDHTIRGGSVDALIVHATTAGKNDAMLEDVAAVDAEDFLYQEAFLTTYRTFISPKQLITKLLYRFNKFHQASDLKKHLSRNTFSLLIRVIDELAPLELTDEMAQHAMGLQYELVSEGTLVLARVLRNKIIEKVEQRHLIPASSNAPLSSIHLSINAPDVMQYKAQEIAEQMTLLDAKLFQTIEIPEVLLWAKEQSEEMSPNLTKFTIHFNNMSYWCRTKILMQEESKDREKYLVKFIKILRYLRKFNNFNSYLAILSAVDSAPIRRLDFQKSNLEALKELSQLIDSSSSFRSYRRAVADSEPPCIPYIGLILQDLTFIHIGNSDTFQDSSVNFAKRWQQFHILDNMRRFKKCNYDFKKNEKLQQAFGNFEDYHSEEVLWQISEKIKPRATPKKRNEVKKSS